MVETVVVVDAGRLLATVGSVARAWDEIPVLAATVGDVVLVVPRGVALAFGAAASCVAEPLDAAAPVDRRKTCPGRSAVVLALGLAAANEAIEIPYFLEIPENVSPARTVWVLPAKAGFETTCLPA